MQFVDENGEVFEREALIKEIEDLLNRMDSKHQSVLASEVVSELDLQSLISIRENLLKKSGEEIRENQEWLFSLVDA